MLDRILRVFNIQADKNQKILLTTVFLSGLLGTYSSPVTYKAVISALPSEWIAFEALFSSITMLIFGMIWKGNFRKNIIQYFAIFCIAESIFGFILFAYLSIIHYNVWVYAIASLIYTNLISILVGKCIMVFKSVLWVEKDRELYDNNNSIVGSVVCISGYFLALVAAPSLNFALFLIAICCILDDIGWIIVYFKNKEKLTEIK